jgi:hypothetical protein
MEQWFRAGRWLWLKVLTSFTFALAILLSIIVFKDPCSLSVSSTVWKFDYKGRCEQSAPK